MKPYEITSLKPGFVIITYNPELVDPDALVKSISAKEWAELVKKGYSGGVFVPEGTKFDSLDDALMNDLGWERIKR